MPGTASRLSDRLRDALVPLLWCLMHTVWLSALMRAIYAAPFVYPQGISFPLWLVPLLLLGVPGSRHASATWSAVGWRVL